MPDTDTAYLWALNKDTGAEAWNIPVPAVPQSWYTLGEPTVANDGTIYARFYNSLRAYNPDSTLKWEYNINAGKEAFEGYISLGMYDNIYVGGCNFIDKYAWMRSIKTSDKTLLWEFTRPYPSADADYVFLNPPVAVDNNMVYTTLAETASPGYRRIYALRDNCFSYTKLWDYEGADYTILGSCREAFLIDWHGERIIALSGGEQGNPNQAGMGYTNNQPPATPSNPTPPDAAKNLGLSVTLTWNCSDSQNHPLKYSVFAGESCYDMVPVDTNIISTSYTLSGLRPGTCYAWKIIATDGQAVAEGPTWTFVTKPANPDINRNGKVNFGDFAILADNWMNTCSEPYWCDNSDLDQSSRVDFGDLEILVHSWLEQSTCMYEVRNLTKLTDGPIQESEPAFNINGTKIAYRNFHEPYSWNTCDIWVMNTDGSGKTRITTDPKGEFNPSFVSDGRISYAKEFGSNNYNIWLVNPDGSNPCELIGGSLRQGGAGHDWHPSELKLIYTDEYIQDAAEIWVADAQGCGQVSNKQKLTDHTVDGYCQYSPVYSRSGSKIAYGSYAAQGAQPHVWVMNSDGSGKFQITFGSGENPVFWWPGDLRVGYVRNGEIWLHNLETGTDDLLLAVPSASISRADLSVDGAKLVFDLSDASGTHIWVGDVICNASP